MSNFEVNPRLKLPPDFQFTQSKLQDFKDCPRRFYLKYIIQQGWPAPISIPQDKFEKAMQNGQQLHQLIERHQSGLSLDTLRASVKDKPPVDAWLAFYGSYLNNLAPYQSSYAEILLTAQLQGFHLAAKFDWIACDGKEVLAIDWKTGRLPDAARLAQRMQTVVYLYVLYRAAAALFRQEVKQFTLQYVSVESEEIRTFDVSVQSIGQYEAQILNVIEAIQNSDFAKVESERPCRYCVYRGLCGRGTAPHDLNPVLDEDWDSDINLSDDEAYTVEF